MNRGFLSIMLVLTMIPFLFQDLGIHNQTYSGIQSMKNKLILQQKINERTYELENGFFLTVKHGLEELGEFDEMPREEKTVYICKKIEKWMNRFPDVELKVGYINKENYEFDEKSVFFDFLSDVQSLLKADFKKIFSGRISPCVNYLYVDEDYAEVMENGFLDYDFNIPSLVNYGIAFVFRVKEHQNEFIVLIPEGSVIEAGE